MVHLELEKMGAQLIEHQRQQEELLRIDPAKINSENKVRSGSLVQTSNGWYYIGIPWGKLMVGTEVCFVISPISPIGKLMIGKSAGESFSWNKQIIEVKQIL
jgi:hypothetical protein